MSSCRFLPDKAIDLVDEAAAKLKMEITSKPEVLDEVDRKVRCKIAGRSQRDLRIITFKLKVLDAMDCRCAARSQAD